MSHVEKRGKNSFRLVVTIGYDEKGVPIRERKTVKAKNTTEAKKQLTLFEAEILTGKYVKVKNISLNGLFSEWDKNTTKDDLGIRTKREYKNIIEKRILPIYGHMKVEDIMPIHVLNFVNSLKKDGARLDGKDGPLAASSIDNCYKAFNHVLEFGVTMKWIAENPAKNIKTPNPQSEETEIYGPGEISILIEHLNKIPFNWRVLVAIALSSSARQGEIVAIEEKHCDFVRGGIYIKQALIVEKGVGVVLKDTKNKRNRFIKLPDVIMKMIEKLVSIRRWEINGAGEHREWPNHLFLFGNEFGKPLRPDSVSQWWGRFMKSDQFENLGLKQIRFHDLRHSSLTYLSFKGIRSKVIQERAGHARIGTTFDIYGHDLDEEQNEAANLLEKLFQKQVN